VPTLRRADPYLQGVRPTPWNGSRSILAGEKVALAEGAIDLADADDVKACALIADDWRADTSRPSPRLRATASRTRWGRPHIYGPHAAPARALSVPPRPRAKRTTAPAPGPGVPRPPRDALRARGFACRPLAAAAKRLHLGSFCGHVWLAVRRFGPRSRTRSAGRSGCCSSSWWNREIEEMIARDEARLGGAPGGPAAHVKRVLGAGCAYRW
jgi:hypothetical protein